MSLVTDPTTVDLQLAQGASWVEVFTWKNGETAETAVGVDLTACEIFAQIREDPDSDDLIASASTLDGTITKDAEGNIRIQVPGADVALGATATKAERQVEIHWNDGNVCRLIQGKVTISREIVK